MVPGMLPVWAASVHSWPSSLIITCMPFGALEEETMTESAISMCFIPSQCIISLKNLNFRESELNSHEEL